MSAAETRGWSIACPPKINLYLRIVRRREDGYHELQTVFQSVSGGDTLTAHAAPWVRGRPVRPPRLADELTLTCDDPEIPTDERNLVIRAALALRAAFPNAPTQGARLTLNKQTPAGGGMGGGSVDAAAALVLLSRLWNLNPSTELLAQLAAGLGSDVPFFLWGGTAVAGGRGEELHPAPTTPLWLVLLRPHVAVPTPWAFRQWQRELCDGPSVEEFLAILASGDPAAVAAALRNDLEPGVAAGIPEIAQAREWLLRQGVLGARMTGSGSVAFGICRDEEHARSVAAQSDAPGRVWAARALTREEAALRAIPIR